MKVLVWSDHHFHNWRQFANRVNGVNSRLRWQITVLDQIKQLIVDEKVDIAIHGGDLFHVVGKLDVDVFNIVYEAFQDFPCPLYLVDGNHDLIDRQTPIWFHRSFEKLIDGKKILACPTVSDIVEKGERVCGMKIVGVGWPEKIEKVYSLLEQTPVDLVVVHKEPIGSRYGGFVFESGVDWKRLERVTKSLVFGHIHEHQIMSEKSVVVGSPMQHNFGDIGKRGCVIVDTETGKWSFKELSAPRFMTVETINDSIVQDKVNYYRILGGERVQQTDQILQVGQGVVVEERLKGETFLELVEEYAKLKSVGSQYLDYVRAVYERIPKEKKILPKRGWKLEKVRLKNFLSFREVDYILKPGVTIVLGRGDEFESNGAGKTALFDAIVWSLFGAVLRDVALDDVVNRQVGEDCEVELDLVNTEIQSRLKIRRVRKHRTEGNDVKVTVQDQAGYTRTVQGSPQVQKLLEEELGCDRALFLHMAYFGQEVLNLLGSLSDVERQELVGKLLDFSELDESRTIVKADEQELKKKLEEVEAKLFKLSVRLESEARSLESLRLELERWRNESRQAREELEVQKVGKTGQKDKALSDLQLVEKEIEQHSSTFRSFVEEDKKIEEVVGERNELRSEASRIAGQVKSLEERVRRLGSSSNVVGEKCSVCGSVISVENIKACIGELDEEKKGWFSRALVIKDELQSCEEKYTVLFIDKQKKQAEIELKNKAAAERGRVIRAEIQQLSSELGRIEGQLGSLQSSESILQKIEAIKGRIEELKDEERKGLSISEEGKEWLEHIKFWIDAFGRKAGIENLLLDRFCNQFNQKVGYYAATLSGGTLQVFLSPQTQLKSGEMRDKLSVRVGLGGPERTWVEYGSLSGGEKRRVDLAMLFALADVFQERYRLPHRLLGVLILDEVFGYLDTDGEESVVSVLQELGKSESVFVVSHTDVLRHHFDNVWTVSKERGVSRLEAGVGSLV